jgi:hypothetical protein
MLLIAVLSLAILPDPARAWTQLLKAVFSGGGAKVIGKEVLKGGGKEVTKTVVREETKLAGKQIAANAVTANPVTIPALRATTTPNSFTTVCSFKGKTSSFQGKEVLKRNEAFDPAHTDALGSTNVDRMRKGLAPIGKDGNPVNLHHENQKDSGKLIELTASEHRKIPVDKAPSEIDREVFNKWKLNYWQDRSKEFGG